jgi:hypothetical protein
MTPYRKRDAKQDDKENEQERLTRLPQQPVVINGQENSEKKNRGVGKRQPKTPRGYRVRRVVA